MNNIKKLKLVSLAIGPPVRFIWSAQFPTIYRMLVVTQLSKLFEVCYIFLVILCYLTESKKLL